MQSSSQTRPSDPPSPKFSGENLRKTLWLFSYLNRYRAMFLIAMTAVLITSGLSFAFPLLIGKLTGESMSQGALTTSANQTALTLLVILTVQAMITFTRMQLLGRAGDWAVADIRKQVYAKLVTLPMTFFNEHRVGEISSRLAADLSLIHDTLVSTLPQFIRHSVLLLAGLSYLFVLSPKLALFMLACLPAVLLLTAFFGFRIRNHSKDAQDQLAYTNVILDETLHGIASVKSFANENYEVGRYEKGIKSYLDSAITLISARALMVAFVIFALFGAVTLVVWFGARMLVVAEIDHRTFVTFCLVTAFVAGSLASLPEALAQLQKSVGATDRVREILDETSEGMPAETWESPIQPANGEICLDNVSFSYPSRPGIQVLTNISCHIRSGERIALVGPSGAGKSTTFALLLRFFDPTSGRLTLDGKDLRNYPLPWLRRQLAIVPQEVLLFGGTIRENIAYGDPGASDDAIAEAARRAYAHDFICSFPERYDTVVGERGIKLSGGQRQRIAIARAILANPSVLLLDEATSSLDAESEQWIQAALEDLMKDRTSLIIAHRLSTVRNADRILVFQEGQIVQQGTHQELFQDREGIYNLLATLQLTA